MANLDRKQRTLSNLTAVAAVYDTAPHAFTGALFTPAWNDFWRSRAHGSTTAAPLLDDANAVLNCASFLTNLHTRNRVTPPACVAVLAAFPPPRATPLGEGRWDQVARLMLLRPTPAEVAAWAATAPPSIDDAHLLIALSDIHPKGVK
jgi:hypothetical protein